MKHLFYTLLCLVILQYSIKAQSDNCATATPITLSAGSACVNGTSVGGTNDNITTTCNGTSVNFVWYQFVTTGTNNTITITPGTMQNPVMVVDGTNCTDASIDFCNSATGTNPITILNAQTVGTTVLISVASTSGNQGTFQICVNSQTPTNPSAGDECTNAIPYCNTGSSPNFNTSLFSGSGNKPSCFIGPGSAPTQDMWITFTCTQSGTIAWTGNPATNNTEFDWAMYNTTAGCPGTQVACNYNYGGAAGANFGMGGAGTGEFSPSFAGVAGQTYTIRISNYSGNGSSFNFSWQGTALIAPVTAFTIAPTGTICPAAFPVNVSITNSSAGVPNWTFGNGNTYTGTTPPAQNYITTGTYAITATIPGACPATLTRYIQIFGPLAATVAAVAASCPGVCNGSAQVTGITGGSGVYAYSWSNGATTNSVSGLCAGVYTVTVSNPVCGTAVVKTVTVTAPPAASLTVNSNAPFCIGGTLNLTASGASTYTWSGSGLTTTTGSAVSTATPATGTYSVSGTSTLGCISTGTVAVVINPKPAATLSFTNPTCANPTGGVIFINNTSPALPAQTISSFASSLGTVSGQTVTGLGAGTPVITLTNNFGCTFTVSATLASASGPSALPLTPSNIICGVGTGSITIGTPTGGTAPYTYNVNGGAFSASPIVTGLASGTYTVGVRDVNGCVFTNTVTISVTTGPSAIAGTTTPAGCGLTNGTYNITGVTGGTGPYTFTVNSVASGSLTTNLAVGTYPVIVRDVNGCLFNTTFNVGGTTGPTSATITTTNASCGSANGSATVTGVTGGLLPYQYSYDGGAFSAATTTTGLTAGPHTVIVQDANTCTLSVTYNILNTGSPTASVTNTVNVSCFGGSNGSFTVTPIGGTGPLYTYTLTSPFQTNGTGFFSGLPQGTYNITVKDQVGCVTTTSVTITQPTVLTLTATPVAALCNGTATGTVNLVGAGGTPTYSYNLNSGAYQTSPTFANQFAAIYSMGIMDANGCTAAQTVQVTQPAALTINVSTQNANCTAANGVASSTVTGGTGSITYTWTGGGAAAISNSVVAGNYTVTATDANGCTISSPAIIGLTPGGTASIVASSSVTCNGLCNGSLTTGMTGGAPPFTYSWSPSGGTLPTAANLCPGAYTCEVTDFYGCKAFASGTIVQPPALTAIMNSNNVKCFNTPTGTVSAAGTGGTAPYTYLWTSPIVNTAATVPNVGIGNYFCTITDANLCSITQSIAVTQPTSLTITSTVTAANCNSANGCATITIAGGSNPYTQTWSNGATTTTICNVFAGTYTINVQDANNCTQVLAVTIPNLSGPTLSISSFTNVSCFGGTNGGATALAAAGTGTYSYSWSNGITVPVATNLVAGVYTASVTDQAGCVASASVSISEPTALTVNIVPTQPKCFGALNGVGVAAAVGGTPSYSYAWTSTGGNTSTSNPLGAGNYGLTVTDGNGCVATASMALVNPPAMVASITATNVTCFGLCNATAVATSTNGIGIVSYFWTGGPTGVPNQTLTAACAGSYSVLATDQNSCTASAQIVITEPTQVTANITSTGSVTCNGGNNGFAAVTAAGGTGPHTYNWSPSGIIAATANTLTAGVYVVTVQDQNLCTATATTTILQPTPLATTLTTTNILCNGGSDGTANIAYLGGAGTTTFLWGSGLQSGNPVNNLLAGPQTVTITSNGACTTVLTFTLTEPAALTAAVSATNSNCGLANGKVCAVVAGGTGSLSSLWSNGITTLCNNNVLAGAYTFSVTDANGCVAQASGLINDIAGPVVSITSSTNVSCFGGNNGAATTTITGGAGAITVFWSPAGQTTQNVSNFNSGIKSITVTDAAGCVGTASVQITEPIQLVSAISSFTNVSCFGQSNGGATVLVIGGTPGYSYLWSPSAQTNSVLTNVPASSPTVTVTDGNGCTITSSLVISQPPALVMAASSFSNISCFGGSNGQISTTVQGGTGAYNYVWLPTGFGSAPSLSGLIAGGYSVTVTDQNACSISTTFNIIEPSALTSTFVSSPATCGLANGTGTVTLGGGTPTYSLVWSTPGTPTGSVVTGLAPGVWSVLGTDSKGCTITQTVNVANPPTSTITGSSVTPPACFGLSNGEITINYTAGSGPYTITWSNPISQTVTTAALTQSVAGVAAGVYTATLTDVNGCVTSQPVNVTQPGLLVLIPTPNPSITICYGQSTQISASGQNGTPAYTYAWPSNPFVGGGPHTVSPTTTTQYTVSVTDSKGCSPSPKIITVNVTPQLAMNGFSVVRCEGDNAVLAPNITSGGNGGPYNFAWSNGVTTISAMTSSISVTAVLPSPNQYTVTIDDGCTIMNPSAATVFTVVVNPNPVIDFGVPAIGCAPLTTSLTASSSGIGDIFTWTSDRTGALGQGNPIYPVFADSGKYSITLAVTSANGCSSTLTKPDYIEVYPQPIGSFYADPQTTSILDPNIDFFNTSQGATTYYWDFGDPAAIGGTNTSIVTNPSHSYTFIGPYSVNLVATSIKGCKDTARIIVEITPDFALYIPNTFTPDGNGLNDIFQPLGVGIDEENFRLDIYDRWGENIFTSNAFRKGWDGTVKGGSKIAEQGVYTYKMSVRDTQGNKHPYVGHVTLLKKEN